MKDDEIDYIETLGTLCDEPNGLTCSMNAARQWGKASKLMSFPSFEAAADAVKTGVISAMLAPGAYPQISRFIMDAGLKVRETFSQVIPDLVVVGVNKVMPREVDVIYHHPATETLLPEVPLTFDRHEAVTSNTQACIRLITYSKACAAVTNRLAANFYDLYVYKVLRGGIVMPFVILAHS